MSDTRHLTGFERLLSLLTKVEPGEGRCVAVLCLQALALMMAYYLIRPVREALILSEGSAVLRSYAVGVQALLLIAIIPAYSALMRYVDTSRVFQRINAFFAVNLLVFALLGQMGLRLGFVFFVWTSIFGVMTVAQFWAFATDLFNARSGHRLLGVIAVGISAGAWIGSRLAAAGFESIGPWGLMIASAATLVGVICLSNWVRSSVPVSSASAPADETQPGEAGTASRHWLGAFALIGRSRYLAGIAVLVVLLNWITSTGEYVLSDWLARTAQAAGGSPAIYIGRFMGSYGASITLVGFLIQLLLVSRIIVKAGLTRALMVTPIAFFVGYLLIGIVPVFALLQPVLVMQRSLDYSLLNTSRSALMLPTSRVVKYQAKTAIDTFCYRLGDLMSTATVFVGLRIFHDPRTQFIWLIVVLSATMTLVAWLIGREYSRNFGAAAAPSSRGSLGNASGGVALQQ